MIKTPPTFVRVIPLDEPLEVIERVSDSLQVEDGTLLNLRLTYRSSSGVRYVTDTTLEAGARQLEFLGHQRKVVPS